MNRDLILGLAMLIVATVLAAYGQLYVRRGWEALHQSATMETRSQPAPSQQSASKPDVNARWIVEDDSLVFRVENPNESNVSTEFSARAYISQLYEGFQEQLTRREFPLRWAETGTNYVSIAPRKGGASVRLIRFEKSNNVIERFEIWGYREGSGHEAEQILAAWWSKVVLPAQILTMEVIISENGKPLHTKTLYLKTEGRLLIAQDDEGWNTQIGPYRSDYPSKF